MTVLHLRDADVSCGGKAHRLGVLWRAGLPVPPGVVVRHRPAAGELLSAAGAELLGAPVAVRSSGLFEDGDRLSFAGQLRTELGPVGEPAVAAAVERCAVSGRSGRVLAYTRRAGLPEPGRVPVLVQRLVAADVAGVLFTRDPRSGAAVTVIEASWGLGSSVADGTVVPDVTVADPTGTISATPGSKRFRVDATGGDLVTSEVADRDRDRPCLGDGLVRRLVELGAATETLLDGPVDLEWAVADGTVWLLQARPVTSLPVRTSTGTSVPGVVTPGVDGTAVPEEHFGVTGTGSSRGVATGPVRVVHDVDGFGAVRRGDVLVCRTTDPAWTPLFGIVAAVVTETGGMLSHASILAREMGVPAVVAAAGAMTRLREGTLVTVDGDAGLVRIRPEVHHREDGTR